MKPKRCRYCKTPFEPLKATQIVCCIECAQGLAEKQRIKLESSRRAIVNREIRAQKEKIKTRADWIKEAQAVFNAWIRYRDRDLPCVSCGRHHQGQWHAGHYRTTAAAPELRFNELNVWKQCSPCNNHKHGNITEYRINLVKRMGVEMVDWLEGKHEPRHYSINDLIDIKRVYKAKLVSIAKMP